MTEDEARQKWCPFARIAKFVRNTETGEPTGVVASGNRFLAADGPLSDAPCIASQCMAWRWNAIVAPGVEGVAGVKLDVGYCGLAGEPQ
jgi:hypothetical protein